MSLLAMAAMAWALSTPAAFWAIIACSRAARSSTARTAAARAWALAAAWSSLAWMEAGSRRTSTWPGDTRWLSATSTSVT